MSLCSRSYEPAADDSFSLFILESSRFVCTEEKKAIRIQNNSVFNLRTNFIYSLNLQMNGWIEMQELTARCRNTLHVVFLHLVTTSWLVPGMVQNNLTVAPNLCSFSFCGVNIKNSFTAFIPPDVNKCTQMITGNQIRTYSLSKKHFYKTH